MEFQICSPALVFPALPTMPFRRAWHCRRKFATLSWPCRLLLMAEYSFREQFHPSQDWFPPKYRAYLPSEQSRPYRSSFRPSASPTDRLFPYPQERPAFHPWCWSPGRLAGSSTATSKASPSMPPVLLSFLAWLRASALLHPAWMKRPVAPCCWPMSIRRLSLLTAWLSQTVVP